MSDPTATDIKSDSEPWSVLENLILVQAIYKCGDTNWVAIAQISSVVKLAGQLYNQRILEIKALIRKDEERFRALVAELDEIRQGKWDSQLAEELKNNPVEADSEVTTNGVIDNSSSTDASQLQPEGDNALADITAPSSLSSPSPSSLPEKQGDTDNAIDASRPESGYQSSVTAPVTAPVAAAMPTTPATPAEVEPRIQESDQELKDVEMEDVVVSISASETPVGSNVTSAAPQTSEEDIEMEDVTTNESQPSISENVEPIVSKENTESSEVVGSEKKQAENDHSNASSPTSASDLSPPGAMEEEEDAVVDVNSSVTETKAEEADGVDGVDGETKEEKEEEEEKGVKEEDVRNEEEEEEEVAIKVETDEKSEVKSAGQEEHVVHQKTPRIKEISAEDFPDAEDSSREDEEIKTKEESSNEIDQDEDTAHEEAEDGATSADDEETASVKTGRKPRKIKTSIPIKRKRRSGRAGTSGDHEEGYNTSDSEMTDSANTNMSDQLLRNQMDDKKWKKILMMIWADIANHRFGAVFMQPIKEQDAPGYYYMIKRPMDLKSIKERIRDGQITNADEFHRDVLLMFMNALMYNGEDTEVYQMALAMMNEVEFIIKNFKSSQSFAPISAASGASGSGSTSNSTTPTTRTAGGGSELLSGPSQPATRKRKSSGLEMTPVE
ncbi:Bromodomain-containing protein 8 [Mortierella sp. AD010]|nr:Bromodomain-containing protein 8 [Mortierella sp. AD010]